MAVRNAFLAACLGAGGLVPTPVLAQEPVVMARHPFITSTWTASYVYDCLETRPSFDLSVKAGQPVVSNFDLGRGADPEIDQLINEALANQSLNDIVVVCGLDGLGSSVMIRTGKTAADGSYIPAWVRLGGIRAPEKVVVTAGEVTE